ncbi:MAG: DNA-directed RNA polymerase subunit omega [Desulfobulbaceae bacterium]|nr:MAG: DNA-directed RNA polymerase subunit omega [Desulfobulbaceae bacterium]
MARITVEDCLQRIGNENRFALIHLAIARVRQHRRGAPLLEHCKNKEIVCALREIASGEVTFDNIKALGQQLRERNEKSTKTADTTKSADATKTIDAKKLPLTPATAPEIAEL